MYPTLSHLLVSSLLPTLSPQRNCTSCLPNPIATTYPHNITGTINATTSVLLVPLPYARSLLPSRLANSILTHAYTQSFPIPSWAYPLILEASIDHDIRFNNTPVIPDFSSIRLTFPFIDLLGDGYTSFRYTGHIFLPADNVAAVQGSEGYGITVFPGFFDPPDAPYKLVNHRGNDISFAVYANSSSSPAFSNYSQPHHHNHNQANPIATTFFRPVSAPFSPSSSSSYPLSLSPNLPLSFYYNITNQPLVGNDTTLCDNMIAFWNTSVSTPQAIIGDVMLSPPLVPSKRTFRGVRGIRAERAFIENNYVSCKSLKG